MEEVLGQVEHLPFPLFKRGKVRDLFQLDGELLLVTTDRISAFDVVLPTLIPQKGRVLNGLSLFWFERMENIFPNHLSHRKLEDYLDDPKILDKLKDRCMIVKKTSPLPFEAVVRGYLAGSAWKEYLRTGKVGGVDMPGGLKESSRFEEPLFTPTTKGEVGEHDIGISIDEMANILGWEMTRKIRDTSIEIYLRALDYTLERGIIIADTKFEFGFAGDELLIIDEMLTPDSSRFWSIEGYVEGRPQAPLDKQFIRDFLEKSRWREEDGPPELPPEVVHKTTKLYLEIYERITGATL